MVVDPLVRKSRGFQVDLAMVRRAPGSLRVFIAIIATCVADQKLVELAERAERMESLRASLADMRAGRVTPVEDMLAEMKQIVAPRPQCKPR